MMKKNFLLSLLLLLVGANSMKAQMDERFNEGKIPYGWYADGWTVKDNAAQKGSSSEGFNMGTLMGGDNSGFTYLMTPPLKVASGENLVFSAKKSEGGGMDSFMGSNDSTFVVERSVYGEHKWIQVADLTTELESEYKTFTISGTDEYTPQVQMDYSFEKQQEVAGDMMYVNLFLLNFHDPSTFKEEVRRVPVDFMYPYRINYTVNMIIPEGYELEELPKPAAYKAQGIKSQAFVQFRQADVNVVSMSLSFVLDSYFAPTEAYKDVRAWYEMLTSMYNTTLVLKKKAV